MDRSLRASARLACSLASRVWVPASSARVAASVVSRSTIVTSRTPSTVLSSDNCMSRSPVAASACARAVVLSATRRSSSRSRTANSARRWSRPAAISSTDSGNVNSARRRASLSARRLMAGSMISQSTVATRKPSAANITASIKAGIPRHHGSISSAQAVQLRPVRLIMPCSDARSDGSPRSDASKPCHGTHQIARWSPQSHIPTLAGQPGFRPACRTASEGIPGRLRRELEIAHVDAEPGTDTGADRHDGHAIARRQRREPEAGDEI